jgi:BirA family biotin operon repressor/biotin-[acetyl-CoA-carboxylase] ligase
MSDSHPAISPDNHPERTAAPIAREVRLEDVDSTSLEARRRIEGSPESPSGPFTVRAERQSAGRGRQGRSWASPAGGLWMTLACPEPAFDSRCLDALGLRVGLSLSSAIAEAVPAAEPRLKWPNDVLVGGRKVAGALTETLTCRGDRWILIGCGVNADLDAADLPDHLRDDATTLRAVDPRSGHADRLAPILERSLLDALAVPPPTAEVARAAEAVLAHRGDIARLRLPTGETVEAKLLGLEPSGRAVFVLASGDQLIAPASVELLD